MFVGKIAMAAARILMVRLWIIVGETFVRWSTERIDFRMSLIFFPGKLNVISLELRTKTKCSNDWLGSREDLFPIYDPTQLGHHSGQLGCMLK
jgi:hypothetical protein